MLDEWEVRSKRDNIPSRRHGRGGDGNTSLLIALPFLRDFPMQSGSTACYSIELAGAFPPILGGGWALLITGANILLNLPTSG